MYRLLCVFIQSEHFSFLGVNNQSNLSDMRCRTTFYTALGRLLMVDLGTFLSVLVANYPKTSIIRIEIRYLLMSLFGVCMCMCVCVQVRMKTSSSSLCFLWPVRSKLLLRCSAQTPSTNRKPRWAHAWSYASEHKKKKERVWDGYIQAGGLKQSGKLGHAQLDLTWIIG